MIREIKIWGERWLIRQDSTHAVSFLKIKKGYRCSWHRHQTKYNLFVVLSGRLGLIIEEGDEQVGLNLGPGESFTIKPGQWHEFNGIEECTCIEEMYVEYTESDIERKKVGGKINES